MFPLGLDLLEDLRFFHRVDSGNLIFTALLLSVIAALIVWQKRNWDAVVRAFEEVAQRTGGEITERRSHKRVLQLVAAMDGTRIVARWVGAGGNGLLNITTIWAECPKSKGLEILVRPRRHNQPTGSPQPWGAFEVVTNDETRSREWIDKAIANAMAKAIGYRFRMVHGRVEASRSGAERDADNLLAAMQAIGMFARGGARST